MIFPEFTPASRPEALLRTRLELSGLALRGSLDELMQAALDAAEHYSGSAIGFFHFVDPEQNTLTLQAWSSNTLAQMCAAEGKGLHYPVNQAGVWADSVRQRRVVIHNDYAALPDKKGMPEGHAPVLRELVTPILREDKVVAVLGVGNKATDYDQSDADVVEQIASLVMDVVERKRTEEALAASLARLREAQRIAQVGDWDYQVGSGKVTWSEQIYVITGLDPEQPPPAFEAAPELLHPDDQPIFQRSINRALEQGVGFQHLLRLLRPDGEIRHVWANTQAGLGPEGKVTRLYGTLQDITERVEAEQRLRRATHFDPLTGLPNARALLEQLDRELPEIPRLALLVLNVDRFAQLNESLGRDAGDRALTTLANRWRKVLPEAALLARLDADQFAVRLCAQDAEAPADYLAAANTLLASMAQPVELAPQHPVSLSLSLGIALHPGDADSAAGLLHAAEDAMRRAKAEKGNQARFYDRAQAQTAIDWFTTETALRQALAGEELFLVYQPQVDAASGRIVAAESLLRWRCNGEVVPPGRFIHVVEGTDLAEPVSRWVLQTACRQARLWLDRQHPIRVAVNVFSDHVTSGHLLEDTRQVLAATGLPPHLLEIEVVESSLLKNPESAARALRELKRLGVGLALDDFGTGYSSLGYLKHYPFDVLKIDQMFARNVTRDPEDAAIVRSTIALAHNLGMRVLAEGVETEPQLRFMARYGCDQIQGYLTCRPTTPEAVETLAMERRDLRPAGLEQQRPSILVVEDEPIEAEQMLLLFEDEGFRAHLAADLDSALNVIGRERVDLIISDHYLEHTTGVEVLSSLRRLFPDVPRIMVSGAEEQEVVSEAVNRGGIRAFLRKPVDPEQLIRVARGLLEEAARGR